MAVVRGNWGAVQQLNLASITRTAFNVGTRDFIWVGLVWSYSGGVTCTGVTCGGVALTPEDLKTVGSGPDFRAQSFIKAGPPQGSQDIVASFSGLTNSAMFFIVSTGADQTAPQRYNRGDTGASIHPDTYVTSAVGDLIHNLIIFADATTFTSWDSGQSQTNTQTVTANFRAYAATKDGAAGTVNLNTTIGGSVNWIALATSIRSVEAFFAGAIDLSGGMEELTAGMTG